VHQVQPLPFKPTVIAGLSERLLVSHYENNYGGAVRRWNAIEQQLAALHWTTVPNFTINGLKREELIAANSAILHELYFDSIGGTSAPSAAMAAAIERDFGSVDGWFREFAALAKALAGGSGWAILAWSERHGRLVNLWGADHAHNLAGARPLLALDMYEHAYHLDFGANAGAYVDAFLRNVAWDRVERRWRGDAKASDDESLIDTATLRRLLDSEAAVAIDVRKPEDLEQQPHVLRGAVWRDPAHVAAWAASLPRERPVVVYCAYGFQVGRDAAAALRAQGIDAHALAGGLSAWRAAGGAIEPFQPKAEGEAA
jgi:Fe-Mn family superoxide dismutase